MKESVQNLPENNWLKGKKVLVTGATNGIGRALALLLSQNDTDVIAHGRSKKLLQELLKQANSKNITTVTGDLAVKSGWSSVEKAIKERQPEVLVLNAGYNIRKDTADGWTDSEIFDMMQVNMISPILCARTFVGLPKLDEPRRLVLVLSTSCHNPREKLSLYVAAKTGLMGFGKTLQQEAKELKVRTLLLYPGRTDTNFRENPAPQYMSASGVAYACASLLCLPGDIVPNDFTFRPECDINI